MNVVGREDAEAKRSPNDATTKPVWKTGMEEKKRQRDDSDGRQKKSKQEEG